MQIKEAVEACPLCKSNVSKLKTNSHILARWLLAHIKTNGRLVKIQNSEVKERAQDNPTADIVCENCENNFTKDDTFAAEFFRDRKYFIKNGTITDGVKTLNYELHLPDAKRKLTSFVMSLSLRNHLYQLTKGIPGCLGESFDELATNYLKKDLTFPLVCYLYSAYDGFHTFPEKGKTAGFDHQDVFIFGYRMWLIMRGSAIPDDIKMLSSLEPLHIPIIDGYDNKLSSDMGKVITEHLNNKK